MTMDKRPVTMELRVVEGQPQFIITCSVCGHEFRDDKLGKNLMSDNPAARNPAKSRVSDGGHFHDYHTNDRHAICECHNICPSD